MTAEQPTMVSTDDRLTAIVERVRHLRGVPHGGMANRYIDDVSFLLQLLSPRIPSVTVDTTRPADGDHTLFDAAGQAAPLVPLDTPSAHPSRAVDHATSVRAGLDPLGRHAGMRHRLAAAFYVSTTRTFVAANAGGESYPFGGLTDEEAAAMCHITRGAPWKRCTDLRQGGWLEWTGETRPTITGAASKVWRMTAEGIAEWEKLARGDEPGL